MKWVLVSLLVAWPAAASAQTADVPAVLSITINDTEAGESLVYLRALPGETSNRDVLIPMAFLQAAGVHLAERPGRVVLEEKPYQSLASLGTDARFAIDDDALAVAITFSPTLFAASAVDLRPVAPAGTRRTRNFSTFANYGLHWVDSVSPSASAEVGAAFSTALLTTTLFRSSGGRVEQGLTTLSVDQPSAMRRIQGGHLTMRGSGLWGATLFTGVGVAREFSLNPYFVRHPLPRITDTLSTPGVADVYVNDRLVRRLEVSPGVFHLTGIPALAGAGETRVVVRDGLGQSRELTSSYYLTSSVLAEGIQDYQYAAGVRRNQSVQGVERVPSIAGVHRVGLTDSLTLGARVEADRSMVSGGPMMTARVGRLGSLEVAAGLSRAARQRGVALSAAWEYVSRRMSVSASIRAASAAFISFSESLAQTTARLDWAAMAAIPMPRGGSISIQATQQWLPDFSQEGQAGQWRRRLTATGSRRLAGPIHGQWRLGRVWNRSSRGLEASIAITATLGSTSMSLSRERREHDGASSEVQLSRSIGAGPGIGYRLRSALDASSIDTALAAQTRYGRVEAQVARLNGVVSKGVQVSGGVASIGRSLAFASHLGESYALVRVPGLSNIRVFSNNVEIGRTNHRGELLVPGMIPYYANRLAIADVDLPADRMIAGQDQLVAPPRRSGALVTFAQARMQAVSGTVVWARDGERVVPAYGLLVIEGPTVQESAIGAGGEFFLEQLPAGAHTATLRYRGDECRVVLTVPTRNGAVVNVGEIACGVTR